MTQEQEEAKWTKGDPLPPAGGAWPDLPDCALKDATIPGDSLGKEIAALRSLHPDLRLRFRERDLDAMDRETKLLLLQQMRELLGLRPLARTIL